MAAGFEERGSWIMYQIKRTLEVECAGRFRRVADEIDSSVWFEEKQCTCFQWVPWDGIFFFKKTLFTLCFCKNHSHFDFSSLFASRRILFKKKTPLGSVLQNHIDSISEETSEPTLPKRKVRCLKAKGGRAGHPSTCLYSLT